MVRPVFTLGELRRAMDGLIFDVDVTLLDRGMPDLIVYTPYVPWSWCVVIAFGGMSVYGMPVLAECWGTLDAALRYAAEVKDIRHLHELSQYYADCGIQHMDVEIWHLVDKHG